MTLRPADDSVLASLRDVLPERVFAEMRPGVLEEPRGRFRGSGGQLLRPECTGQVAEIIRWANAARVGVIPFGGGTGLVGGHVLPDGPAPLILSLERMSTVFDIDPVDNVLVVGAGAVLADVQTAARDANRLFPLSIASEGSCQIGGNLATNAGGMQVVRYGSARDLCLGLEAVLPDGSIYRGLNCLRKDNTGYDLRNLLIGSEGTLGVITAATLALHPLPGVTVSAFAAISSPSAGVRMLREAADRLGNTLSVFELISKTGIDFLRETVPGTRIPLSGDDAWYLLVEVADEHDSGIESRVEDFLARQLEDGRVSDAVLAANEAQRHAFRHIREMLPEANRRIGAIASHDISVPASRIQEFIDRGLALVEEFGPLRVNCFGHIGDGNLHFNIFPPAGCSPDELESIRRNRDEITRRIHALAVACQGSFSAEHGVGRLKTGELNRYGDPGRLRAMRGIKAALDPSGIMNPGAVLD